MTPTVDVRLSAARQALLPFGLAAVAASAVVQVAIALDGQRVGVAAGLLTAVVALGYAIFLWRYGRDLGKVRFAQLAAHAVVYAAVNVGFGLHFFVLAVVGSPAVEASSAGEFAMDPGWFGAAVAMPALWGVGLLVHALGALAGRGFEAPR